MRHPRDCRYWEQNIGGCKRGELCKYLHKRGIQGETDNLKHLIINKHGSESTATLDLT